MARYRKRPIIIEAMQFVDIQGNDPVGVYRHPEDGAPYVVTVHGAPCPIIAGDWIIPESDGVHYYPCKDDIFKASYELVTP